MTPLEKYLACLLRFPHESNDAALERFFAVDDSRVESQSLDIIRNWAYEGVALTPDTLVEMGGKQLSQDGLVPEQAAPLKQSAVVFLDKARKAAMGRDLLAGKDVDVTTLYQPSTVEVKPLSQMLDEGLESYARRAEDDRQMCPTLSFPWKKINDLVPHIAPDDLVVLSGMTGTGKSSAALQIALWNTAKFSVLYFHNEDTPERLMLRIVAQMQQMDDPYCEGKGLAYPDLVRYPLKHENEVAKWVHRIKAAIGDRLQTVYCPGWTPEQIVSKWRQQRHQQPISLVVIDYLNKLEVSGHIKLRGSVAYAYEYAVELFKRESGRTGALCPCLLVQQEYDGKVRDTKSTVIKGQIVISLERNDDDQGLLETGFIKVVKANDGLTGSINARFYPPYMAWLT